MWLVISALTSKVWIFSLNVYCGMIKGQRVMKVWVVSDMLSQSQNTSEVSLRRLAKLAKW